jgi:tetratricopeptide (TPR) repeat protein
MMRLRVLFIISAILSAGTIYGQQSYDLLLRSKALISSGNYSKAVEILSAGGFQPDSRLLVTRADARILEGNYQAAIADLNSANILVHNSGEYGLSRVYALKGDASTSLYHLEITMKSASRKSEKEIMLDPAFSRIENSPEWRQFWKKEWYTGEEKMLSEVEFYVKSGKPEEAESIVVEMQKNFPGNETTYAAALVSTGKGKYGDAVRSLTELLVKDPDNEAYLRLLAAAQSNISNPTGAISSYNKLINMEIPDPELYLLRAGCFGKTGERDKALNDITKYLSFFPESRTALSMAGRTLSASGDNLKALEYFSENVKLHPNDPECYIDRGNSYFLAKAWQWAINDFSMSLDLAPGNADVWLSKGIALVNEGKTDDGCHDFRRAFALGNKRSVDYLSRYCIK